jgi:prepilin-type processing-associated H-X9-DG protein
MFTSYAGIMGSAAGPGVTTISGCCDSGGSGISAYNGCLYAGSQVTMTGITDGSSNTIIVGEQSDDVRNAAGQPIRNGNFPLTSQGPHGWTMGTDNNSGTTSASRVFNCTAIRYQINQRGVATSATDGASGANWNTGANHPLSSTHGPNGANVAFADGTVRTLTASAPVTLLQALATRANSRLILES